MPPTDVRCTSGGRSWSTRWSRDCRSCETSESRAALHIHSSRISSLRRTQLLEDVADHFHDQLRIRRLRTGDLHRFARGERALLLARLARACHFVELVAHGQLDIDGALARVLGLGLPLSAARLF